MSAVPTESLPPNAPQAEQYAPDWERLTVLLSDVQTKYAELQDLCDQVTILSNEVADVRVQTGTLRPQLAELQRSVAVRDRVKALEHAQAAMQRRSEQIYRQLLGDRAAVIEMLGDVQNHIEAVHTRLNNSSSRLLMALMTGFVVLVKAPDHIKDVLVVLVLVLCAVRAVVGICHWW